MAHIEFVDETFRDGMQSLWGMRLQAGMALPVAGNLDRTGFNRIELSGSNHFEVLVRYCKENPWDSLDALVEAMPRTVLRSGMRSNAMGTFRTSSDAIMDAWMRQLNRHGCRSFWIYDLLYNVDKMTRLAKVAKEFGSEVTGALMYTLSPVHDDAYYADKADKLSASPDIDTLLLYDTAGVITKERMATLIPAIKAKSRGKPLEMHANNLLGQSAKNYLDAIELGVSVIHTASRPMANGPSVPSTEIMVHNLELLGHTHSLDKRQFQAVADRMEQVGKAAGFLVNQSAEYNLFSVQHQIPGGMTGTLKAQLAQHGMSDRLDEVLAEVAIVRKELGYPGMATPFSQLVGIQAVLNLVHGERYKTIPDEIIEYALGNYGQTVAPIEPNILDQILSSPRAKFVKDNPPEQPTIEELRKRYGTRDDDELLLKVLLPEADLERMKAAGPLKRDYPLLSSPEMEQVGRLMKLANLPVVQMQSEGLSLTLRS
ncbi:pyruvate carboxylase [Paraburkholderia aspalathi]|uniref:Oxaloacetate decarboxylase, alpha subunit n=1 Tax=Paraburkholderia aspalathi TaxID=1324617 RepID=A0A1I7EA18_9BURK|nr:pyruvate carboxylase [Paraburkholderia aspalathi]SFU20693.1 oxaloacetate decarboxylase, alpha subunit [Paraburkholderia aspalathi]